jgi:hypothetical protein
MYCIQSSAVRFKSFETLHEATMFANKQPIESVLEIKYYDDVNKQKIDRN